MKIKVLVKTNSKKSIVEKTAPSEFIVRLKSPAKDGKANKELMELLAGYFNIPKTGVNIKSGLRSKYKIIEIIW